MPEFQLMYDLRWVAQAKQGDQQAFTRLYNASYNAVYHLVCPMCKSADEVDDIIQDSYIQCYQNLYRLQDDTRFIPWMKAIARNKALDYLKKKRDVLFSELESDDPDAPELEFADDRNTFVPDIQTDKMETARLLGQIMQSLPEKQKICITMFYIDNMHIEEIARMLGTSEGSVKQALMHGRKNIKEKVLALEKQGTKLYGLAPLPFFYLLVKSWLGTQFIPNAGICQAVLAISGGATAAGAAGAAMGAGSAVEAAGAGAGTFAAGAGTTAATAAGTGAAAAGAAGMTGAATVGGIAAAGTIIGGKLAVKAAIIVGAVILGGGGIAAGAAGVGMLINENHSHSSEMLSNEELSNYLEETLDVSEENSLQPSDEEVVITPEDSEAQNSLINLGEISYANSSESSQPANSSIPEESSMQSDSSQSTETSAPSGDDGTAASSETNGQSNAAFYDLLSREEDHILKDFPVSLVDIDGDGVEELIYLTDGSAAGDESSFTLHVWKATDGSTSEILSFGILDPSSWDLSIYTRANDNSIYLLYGASTPGNHSWYLIRCNLADNGKFDRKPEVLQRHYYVDSNPHWGYFYIKDETLTTVSPDPFTALKSIKGSGASAFEFQQQYTCTEGTFTSLYNSYTKDPIFILTKKSYDSSSDQSVVEGIFEDSYSRASDPSMDYDTALETLKQP